MNIIKKLKQVYNEELKRDQEADRACEGKYQREDFSTRVKHRLLHEILEMLEDKVVLQNVKWRELLKLWEKRPKVVQYNTHKWFEKIEEKLKEIQK